MEYDFILFIFMAHTREFEWDIRLHELNRQINHNRIGEKAPQSDKFGLWKKMIIGKACIILI